jgi:hypothetical protein
MRCSPCQGPRRFASRWSQCVVRSSSCRSSSSGCCRRARHGARSGRPRSQLQRRRPRHHVARRLRGTPRSRWPCGGRRLSSSGPRDSTPGRCCASGGRRAGLDVQRGRQDDVCAGGLRGDWLSFVGSLLGLPALIVVVLGVPWTLLAGSSFGNGDTPAFPPGPSPAVDRLPGAVGGDPDLAGTLAPARPGHAIDSGFFLLGIPVAAWLWMRRPFSRAAGEAADVG